MKRKSNLVTIAIAAGAVAAPALFAQDPPPMGVVPADATSAYGHGTSGEIVYNLNYIATPGQPYGQYPPGIADDLHLTRAGDLVCFTISVFNGSSNSLSPIYGPGTYVPVDAVVQFYDSPPVAGLGFPGGSMLAEYHVEIPAPDSPAGTVWTITTDLTTPVAVPQDIWIYVTTPDAIGSGGYSYAGPVFDDDPATPDVGSTDDSVWFDDPYFTLYPTTIKQAVTVRLAEESSEPPVVSCSEPAMLWLPLHDLVDVSGTLPTISDPDTPLEDLTVDVRVVSDEPEVAELWDPTSWFAPDFKTQLANGADGFFVRAERRFWENGRVYLAIVTVSDGDNTVTHVCPIAVVPLLPCPELMLQVLVEADARAEALQNQIDLVGLDNVDLAALGLYEHGLSNEIGCIQ